MMWFLLSYANNNRFSTLLFSTLSWKLIIFRSSFEWNCTSKWNKVKLVGNVSAVHWNGQQLLHLQSINYTIGRYRWQRCTPVLSFKFRANRKFNIVDLLFNFRQIPLSFRCIVFISNASLNLFVGNRRLNKKKEEKLKWKIASVYHTIYPKLIHWITH